MFRTLFLAFALLASAPLFAHDRYNPDPFALHNHSLKVEVLNADNQPIELASNRYRSAQGKLNSHYALRLTNPTNERVWVVVSINGINPSNGRRAYQGQPGIVLDPGESRVIDTQRLNGETKPLTFTRMNEDIHGKIAIGVFRERMDYPHRRPWGADTQARYGGTVQQDPQTRAITWAPPSGARFRKLTDEPEQRIYFEYAATE